MGAYEETLRHIAEPQAPSDRETAVGATIHDYEALFFAEALREFAHYGESDHNDVPEIAVGYASHIDVKVRDEAEHYVTLYAHTRVAAETLLDALYHHIPESGKRGGYPMAVFRSLEESFAEVFAHYVDGADPQESASLTPESGNSADEDEMAPATPPKPNVENETVVFDNE